VIRRDPVSELEEDKGKRLEEIAFLENICGSLQNETQQDRFRRSMLLMLYAHYEGFAKLAFEIYRRHLNDSALVGGQVKSVLATCLFQEILRGVRIPESARDFLPDPIKEIKELRPLGLEVEIVERSRLLLETVIEIDEKFISVEDNLWPVVLKKVLFRLGLPHDLFDAHEGSIKNLVNRRNGIGHGAETRGVDLVVYGTMKNAVLEIMDTLQTRIIDAIENKLYLQR
jgi:hypothetical protein